MPELHAPWLEIAIFVPLVTAVLLLAVRPYRWKWRISSVVSALVLIITLLDWSDFATLKTFEAHDPNSVTQSLFGKEIIVVDEFNAPLLVLAAALFFVVILATPNSKKSRFPFSLTLVSKGLLLALLSCRSPAWVIGLFAVQWFVPMLELRGRQQSWRFFAAHQVLSVVLIVAGWLLIDPSTVTSTHHAMGCALVALGLLIRCGCVPFHCWIVDFFDRASLGTALLFVTPMAGAYGMVRLVLPIIPEWLLVWISLVSLLTAIYASVMVLVQTNTRRFYAYLIVGNSSLLLVGLESLTALGLTASLSLWLSIGISLVSLGVIIRSLEGRVGRLSIDRYHGLFLQMPLLAVFFLLALLASIGFPGTVGFVGIELLVECAMRTSTWYAVLVVLAVTLNAIAALRVYFRLFGGTVAPATISMQPRPAELVVIWLFALLILVGGFFPQRGVSTRYHAARELLQRRSQVYESANFQSRKTATSEITLHERSP